MKKLYLVTQNRIKVLRKGKDYYECTNIINFTSGKKISIKSLNQILINGNLGILAFSSSIVDAIKMNIKINKLWRKLKKDASN